MWSWIENRGLIVRDCNSYVILVDVFSRGEYMDTGQDYPADDQALRTVRQIIEDLETSGPPVAEYLADPTKRNKGIKAIPCHLAIRQLSDGTARGIFTSSGTSTSQSRTAAKGGTNAPPGVLIDEHRTSTLSVVGICGCGVSVCGGSLALSGGLLQLLGRVVDR